MCDPLWILGLIVLVYYLIYLIVPWFLDCDFCLAFKEKYGQPVDTLKGKVVWITGASSGIGEYLAYALARAGCQLTLSARRESELERVKRRCLAENQQLKEEDIQVLVLDICDVDQHERSFRKVIDHFGKLDILVNNAGRSQRANWENIDLKVDKDLFDLNVFSVVSLSRVVLPYFMKKNEGHLVVTSSLAGVLGVPFSGSYTGSKHAIHGYFESLRTEKMNYNIAITIVCPGPIQTNFLEEAFTEKPNEKFAKKSDVTTSKMSAERCGNLMAVALANRKLTEVWISPPQPMQLAYLSRYYPNIGYYVMQYLGQKYIQRLRDNKVTVADSSKDEKVH